MKCRGWKSAWNTTMYFFACSLQNEPRLFMNLLLHQHDLAGEVSIQVSSVCSMFFGLIGSDRENLLYLCIPRLTHFDFWNFIKPFKRFWKWNPILKDKVRKNHGKGADILVVGRSLEYTEEPKKFWSFVQWLLKLKVLNSNDWNLVHV